MNNKIVIKNLYKGVTESVLKEFISSAGNIKNIAIFEDVKFENPGMIAMIEMGSSKEAEKAIKMFNGNILNGKEIYIGEVSSIKIPDRPIIESVNN